MSGLVTGAVREASAGWSGEAGRRSPRAGGGTPATSVSSFGIMMGMPVFGSVRRWVRRATASRRRGMRVTRLRGRVRWSSCGTMILSIALFTAALDAGSTKTNVEPHCAAVTSTSIAPVPISSNEIMRNRSLKPSSFFVMEGVRAGVVDSVSIPAMAMTTSTSESAIQRKKCARTSCRESFSTAHSTMACPAAPRCSMTSLTVASSADECASVTSSTATCTLMSTALA